MLKLRYTTIDTLTTKDLNLIRKYIYYAEAHLLPKSHQCIDNVHKILKTMIIKTNDDDIYNKSF